VTYILIHRDPSGLVQCATRLSGPHPTTYATPTHAARSAGYLFSQLPGQQHGMGGTLARNLAARPIGSILDAWKTGHHFRILRADFTQDGITITPGLEVTENNLRRATIDAEQFMDTSDLMPGGSSFDRWYYVIYPGDDRPSERFDSTRLTTSWKGNHTS
jgi:hypothetical protein